MKTPREILSARHQTVAPKLDAIRREVVWELHNKDAKTQSRAVNFVTSCLGCSNKLWLELIWPCRRVWTGLAAVWILIFTVNFLQRDPSELMARKISPPTPEMILAFRQQQRLLAELIGQTETRAAEPRKTFVPRPRTESGDRILTT